MFELPEMVTLARQMNDTLMGRVIRSGRLGNSPHKFVWYNRSDDEFSQLTQGKRIGGTCYYCPACQSESGGWKGQKFLWKFKLKGERAPCPRRPVTP